MDMKEELHFIFYFLDAFEPTLNPISQASIISEYITTKS